MPQFLHAQTGSFSMPTARSPRLAITLGDVNGIGPEILLKALARREDLTSERLVVYGDMQALDAARCFTSNAPPFEEVADLTPNSWPDHRIPVINAGFPAPTPEYGQISAETGRCAIEWFQAAVRAALQGDIDAIVTCPIHKEAVQRAGYACAGHTDLIASMTDSHDYRMCLFAGNMRVVHITGHLSLTQAIQKVRKERIETSIRLGDEALRRLGLAAPRIAVAGLNPHAGEAGHFGREEIDEIAPAIAACQETGIACSGPHPPDTVFRRMHLGEFDMVIAMYHDQGHIPMKLIAMDEGVNVTLGIPLIRTSVDHGTAFDIAGRGIAREDSLIAAIRLAARMANR